MTKGGKENWGMIDIFIMLTLSLVICMYKTILKPPKKTYQVVYLKNENYIGTSNLHIRVE